MKRLIALTLALLTAVSMLGACGKEEKQEETKAQTSAVEWPKINSQKLHNDVLAGDWASDTAILSFDGNQSFWFTDPDGNSLEGRYQFDGLDLYLRDREGLVYCGFADRDGHLKLDEYPGTFVPFWELLNAALAGLWTYQSGDVDLTFAEDGTFTWRHMDATGEGIYFYDEAELSLMDGEEITCTGYLDDNGCLHLENMIGWFYPEGGTAYLPLPEEDQKLLTPDLETAKARNPMDNGVVLIQEDKGVYERIRSDWFIDQDDIPFDEPGRRALAVMAACYIPYSNVPSLSGDVLTQCNYVLYDRYTGLSFPFVDAQKDEDDTYHFSFDSRDGRVEMLVAVEDDSTGPVGDCANILTISLTIVMPDWYDGLVFTAMTVPENMDAMEEETGRERIPYRSSVLDYPEERMESSLTFSIG